jgi:MoaA/NifB/PqqE/SkfB family radical SAM enzyme
MNIQKGSLTGAERTLNYETINPQRAQAIANRFNVIKNYADYFVSRLEVVLTERCNMNCVYCHKHKKASENEQRIDKDALKAWILEYARHHCKFVHFTGGEPTLIPYLPELVQLCHSSGMDVSITTNGIASHGLYKDLLEKGLSSIHLSLDAINETVFSSMTGVNKFDHLIENARLFKSFSSNAHKVKLTLNVCLNPDDIESLAEKLEFFVSLNPDDIKLMTISSVPYAEWHEKKEYYSQVVLPQLLRLLPGNGYVMLRSRLPRLLDPTIRGFHSGKPGRCYLTPEERVIGPDGNYYQCYIYYRENGKAIGNILQDSFAVQTQNLFESASGCSLNPLCAKYCADITYMANRYIGELVAGNMSERPQKADSGDGDVR